MTEKKSAEIRNNETSEGRELREFLASRTGTFPDDWFLTFRAREALQVVFEVIRLESGRSEVLMQPFTCSTVAEAVLAGGMKPVYADISMHNLSTDVKNMSVSADTGAVVVQHTFGIIDAESALKMKDSAHAGGAILVEDCAQCASRMATDSSDKPLADISIHSFGLEKMTSTFFGAAAWVDPDMENRSLHDAIVGHFKALPPADKRVSRSVSSYLTRIRILNHLPVVVRRPLRSYWTARRRFIPGIAPVELRGGTLLDPSVPGKTAALRILDALNDINGNESQRLAAVRIYADAFANIKAGLSVPECALAQDQPLLWFPVIAENADEAERLTSLLNDNGYYSSGWGRPLLFPGVTDTCVFRLDDALSSCPVSKKYSDGIVLLPTKVSADDAARIIDIIFGNNA